MWQGSQRLQGSSEGMVPEAEAIDAEIAEEPSVVKEAIAPVIEEPDTLLHDEGSEEATTTAELEATVEAIAAEAETILEEFEEAIAQQEPEVIVSEFVELEIIELDGATLGNDAFPDADEIIEAVEIKVVEVEVVETIGESERAIAPEPTEEDWGEDDLDDL